MKIITNIKTWWAAKDRACKIAFGVTAAICIAIILWVAVSIAQL